MNDKFYGIEYSVTKCSKCLIGSHNFCSYFLLEFPVTGSDETETNSFIGENV